jgi:hypothetical protein
VNIEEFAYLFVGYIPFEILPCSPATKSENTFGGSNQNAIAFNYWNVSPTGKRVAI